MAKRLLLTILFLLAMCGVAWGDISSGLVGYWPLNQNFMQNATTVSDIGSGSNDGTLVNSPVVGADSTTFNGTTAYIDCGSDALLKLDGAFSISFWFNKSETDDVAYVLDGDGWYFRLRTASSLYFIQGYDTQDLSLRAAITENPIVLDTWYHVVLTWDNVSSSAMYQDGIECTTYVVQGNPIGSRVYTADSLHIAGSGANLYPGQISDVRIYNRALTPSEVTELYNLGRNSIGNATMEGVGVSGGGTQ